MENAVIGTLVGIILGAGVAGIGGIRPIAREVGELKIELATLAIKVDLLLSKGGYDL